MLDLESDNDLFLAEEELDIDDEERKKELLRVLEGEVSNTED
jgi:hypothetical protein